MMQVVKQKNTKKKCQNCQNQQYALKTLYSHKPIIIKKEINEEMNIRDIINILGRIPQDQWEILFKEKPSYRATDLIFHSYLPILPEQVRPTYYDQQFEHKWGSLYGNLVTAIQSNNIANAYNLLTQITGIPFPG